MLPSIRKFFKSISLCGLFSLFPLLPISAQDIADQHPLPDSIGSKMKYNATIEMKKGYLSGICMLIRDKDGYKGSIFNEFGISVLDFTYQPVTGKVKLENVIQLLDKWYIKRLLKQDLSQVIKNLQKGISIYDNKKYKIHYQFTELEERMEEKENLEDEGKMEDEVKLENKVLKFCMWFKYGLKAQKLLAQGNALGIKAISKAPCKGKSLINTRFFKAFALTGRQGCVHNNPGRCPELGASALSGRVELTCET